MRPFLIRCLLFVGLLLPAAPVPAAAHTIGASYAEVVAHPDRVDVLVRVRARDAAFALKLDADQDGVFSEREFESSRPQVGAFLLDGIALFRGPERVPGVLRSLRFSPHGRVPGSDAPEPILESRLEFPARAGAERSLHITLFSAHDPEHACFARITDGGGERGGVFRAGTREVLVDAAAPAATALPAGTGGFLLLGLEHILGGTDHVLFLLALVAILPPLRSLLITVTAFTLGHSLTLALATLGFVTAPPALVEPAIALSIAYVCVENLSRPPDRPRAGATFLFGLVHGLGFSGILQELALDPGARVLALGAFNLGVETGQILILGAAAPILYGLDRALPGRGRTVIRVAASVVGLGLATAWFFERV